MTAVYYKSRRDQRGLWEEHGEDGAAILASEPSRLMRGTILVLVLLLIVAVLWSFIGKSEVMVQASGVVSPQSRTQEVFVPMKGDLVDVYVTEGMPVMKGDVVARVNSPNVVELAGQAAQAKLHLGSAQRDYDSFPAKRKAMEKEVAALKAKLEGDQLEHERNVAEGVSKLAEEQRLKLDKARAKLAKAGQERDQAKRVLEQHQRLFASPGGGGISRDQVEEKRQNYEQKVLDYRLAETELGEFESTLTTEYDKRKQEIEKKSQELLASQAQYESQFLRLAQEEEQVKMELRLSRSKAQAASRISYEDIDEDNYLRIRAPFDGTVVRVIQNGIGGQIDEKTPVAAVAPKDSPKILEIQINERDRAFLQTGMPVKIKFNAFPFQRYGVLRGELQQISPTASMDQETKQLMYRARVGLKQDYFLVNDVRTPVRFGMAANAEIIVATRRLIDLAIDPLRNAG